MLWEKALVDFNPGLLQNPSVDVSQDVEMILYAIDPVKVAILIPDDTCYIGKS